VEAVDRFIKGKRILSERTLGNQKEAALYELTQEARNLAAMSGLTISQPSLQDLFIYLTGKEGEEE
jgi:ABC-2 type transport system ATP-binding protein